jgi:hypothetical protein
MAQTVAPLALMMTRGEDRTFAGTHQTSATDATPVNITGWTLQLTARTADGHVLFTKAPTVTNGPTGAYSFTVTAADSTVTPSAYPCDLWRTDAGTATILGLGTLTVQADVRV